MERKIYNLLDQFRLQMYYKKFIEMGVKDERDFLDSIDDDTLNAVGLTHVEKRRFSSMQAKIRKLGNSAALSGSAKVLKKPSEAYHLMYRFPKCPETRTISDLDPSQNTLEDLMLRIHHQETISNDLAVCLYSAEGLPLTDDPFFNTWCLNERHIENGAEIYAIFTPKANLQVPVYTIPDSDLADGDDNVRCHIMLKGDFEVNVDLTTDTLRHLRNKLSHESGIPARVLHFKNITEGFTEVLEKAGINSQSVVQFYLSSSEADTPDFQTFFTSDVRPSIQQSQKGMSVFFSTLLAINMKQSGEGFKKVLGYVRHLTGCNALAQSLHHLMVRKETLTRIQKVMYTHNRDRTFQR
ncbi:uncharacterized protein LOC108922761 [Scleropages formosus]|uniref:uncharacterized protein LOC108922761 n=1 Tax=Scleropages formosus TaxID=113540 RepID=UPI0010FAA58D|nr:uncharacterized protein LOC108922761 [Scleropages formosus]